MANSSPFASLALQRAATFSFALVDEVHSLVDEPVHVSRRLHRRVKQLGVFGLILFGTLISTLGKLAYEVEAVGRDGTTRPFQKPWFLVLLMFTGMSLNLPLSLFLDLVRSFRRRSKWFGSTARSSRRLAYEALYTPLLQFDADDEEIYQMPQLQSPTAGSIGAATATAWLRLLDKQLLLLAVPTGFDLLGSALLNVGLLSVTASATQMLRQSLLLFAALLGVLLWHKRLNRYHLAGLTGCTAGLLMVAAAALASGFGGSGVSPHRGTMAAGMGLILASQMLAAGQLLMDQSWYAGRLQLSPLKVVGSEGLLGMVIMLLVVLPLTGVSSAGPEGWGLREDTWDSLLMVASRPQLLLLLLAYTGSLQGYNICGMATTGELSAVETSLLQAVRTLFVWIINLLIYVTASALAPDSADQLEPLTPMPGYNSTALAAAAAVGLAAGTGGSSSSTLYSPSGSSGSATASLLQQKQWPQLLRKAIAVPLQSLQLHQHLSGGATAAVSDSSSSSFLAAVGLAAASEEYSNALNAFPGEPWLSWSFLQAAGFVILVIAAVTYSKGDNERLRKQLQDEAALIMLDQPPSGAGSLASGPAGRHYFTHDIDAAAYLRSFARDREDNYALYGITPVPSQSFMTPPAAPAVPLMWSLGQQRPDADGGYWEALSGEGDVQGGSPLSAASGSVRGAAGDKADGLLAAAPGLEHGVAAAAGPDLWGLEQGQRLGNASAAAEDLNAMELEAPGDMTDRVNSAAAAAAAAGPSVLSSVGGSSGNSRRERLIAAAARSFSTPLRQVLGFWSVGSSGAPPKPQLGSNGEELQQRFGAAGSAAAWMPVPAPWDSPDGTLRAEPGGGSPGTNSAAGQVASVEFGTISGSSSNAAAAADLSSLQ